MSFKHLPFTRQVFLFARFPRKCLILYDFSIFLKILYFQPPKNLIELYKTHHISHFAPALSGHYHHIHIDSEVIPIPYKPIAPERCLDIRQIYTIHYFEYTSSYAFVGESHNFWEFLYVDKGEVQVTADDTRYDLSRGQLIFHPPGQFHALSANGIVAPNLVVVSFRCDSPAMEFFKGRILTAGSEERTLLARIIHVSRELFSNPLNDPTTHQMTLAQQPPFGSGQLLCAWIEELLIRLIRRDDSYAVQTREQPRHTQARVDQISAYLEQRLDQNLSIHQIGRDNLIGRAQLEQTFHRATGGGVIDHFNRMKIEAAKQLIRENQLNFTQIAARLGFRSVQYFSRRFKLTTGMSPSEYARSVKMLSELPPAISDDSANNL